MAVDTPEPWLTAGLPELVNQGRATELLREWMDRPLLDRNTVYRWWHAAEAGELVLGCRFPPPLHLVTEGGGPGHAAWDPRDLEAFAVEFLGRATDAA